MSIPVRNVYHLLTYAWNRLEESDQVRIEPQDADLPLLQLLTRVLLRGVTAIVKRGLVKDYLTREEATDRLRGKLLLGESVRQRTLSRAQAVCAFDELSADILPNQLIKATLHRLLIRGGMPSELLADVQNLFYRFGEVSLLAGSDLRLFEQVRLHRHSAHYGLPLDICRLIQQEALATEAAGTILFRDFTRDKAQMAALFESFVRGFCRHHLPGYRVTGRQLRWQLLADDQQAQDALPVMRTDLVIEGAGQQLLIDCKYYKKALRRNYTKESLNSAHIYQLYAYLHHLQQLSPQQPMKAMLLYPVVEKAFDYQYSVPNSSQRIRVATLNLDQEWQLVERDLLRLIQPMV